jgi:hypothetical protein
VTCEIKAVPLSLWSIQGKPNLGTISFKKAFATLELFPSEWEKPQPTV